MPVGRPTPFSRVCRVFAAGVVIAALLGLSGCATGPSVPTVSVQNVSPFVAYVTLAGFDLSGVTGVQYTIAPKPGSVSKPVQVEYSMDALSNRGDVGPGQLQVPVFGLYAGYQNQVSVQLEGGTGNNSDNPQRVLITTASYSGPSEIYTQPDIEVPRTLGSDLGFDFMFIKSELGTPVIIDTDGEVRWAATGITNSMSSAFDGDGFIIGDPGGPTVYQLQMDGSISSAYLPSTLFTDFSHNMYRGKHGFLAEVDESNDGVANLDSNVIEFQDSGFPSILHRWDLGAILSAYMSSHGDNPAEFVRPGVDWFHANAAIYDPSDDSIIVSSRENFLIKLDYKTGAIIWILGDPTKYWYTFPSLRAKALTLMSGGLYPIGQHGITITPDGLLMLFNDGLGSLNQPSGAPAGETRTYSAVSAYSINEASMTAVNVWNYTAGQTIYSSICSSAFEAPDKSLFVDYATADSGTQALLVGLDPNHNVVFEFEYPTTWCNTAWNAQPIALDDLKIDR